MNVSISNTITSPLKKCLWEKRISNELEISLEKVFLKGEKLFA